MDTQSLGGLVLLALVLVIVLGIIPSKTKKSLKNATRHIEDKYSSTLHIVDDESVKASHTNIQQDSIHNEALRADEDSTNRNHKILHNVHKKNNSMRYSVKNIRSVRSRRKAGVHRRRILVSMLLIATILTGVAAFYYRFNYAYVAIPGGLLCLVMVLGAWQAHQARKWEADVSAFLADVAQSQDSSVNRSDNALGVMDMNVRRSLTFRTDNFDTAQFEKMMNPECDVLSREIVSVRQVSVAHAPNSQSVTDDVDSSVDMTSFSDVVPANFANADAI